MSAYRPPVLFTTPPGEVNRVYDGELNRFEESVNTLLATKNIFCRLVEDTRAPPSGKHAATVALRETIAAVLHANYVLQQANEALRYQEMTRKELAEW